MPSHRWSRCLLLGAAVLLGACGAQPDVRSIWRMPQLSRPAEGANEGAMGHRWVYASGEGDSADRGVTAKHARGDLPDSMRAPTDALWLGDEAVARRRARDTQRPLLIDFYAEWCDPCVRLANDTFADPDLRAQLRQQTVPLQIDVTEESSINREQLKRYKVFSLPTLLLLSPSGGELWRYQRYVSAAELSERLHQVANGQPASTPADDGHAKDEPKDEPAPDASAEAALQWCAPELEVLPGDVCYAPDPKKRPRRTLVVFLHGWVQHGLGWQHAQQRAIVRGAKRLGYSVLTPRGRTGGSKRGGAKTVAWPTGPAAQKAYEEAVLAEWRRAQTIIEERQGAAFDEVFVVGFSNGAYYASSLAMRGRLKVDGYALFAGGSAYPPRAAKGERAPVFVGICSKDSTAKRARELRKQLRRDGWPHRAETRKVGHTMADKHLDNAIRYLREQTATD